MWVTIGARPFDTALARLQRVSALLGSSAYGPHPDTERRSDLAPGSSFSSELGYLIPREDDAKPPDTLSFCSGAGLTGNHGFGTLFVLHLAEPGKDRFAIEELIRTTCDLTG